jgi:hypothetical protein
MKSDEYENREIVNPILMCDQNGNLNPEAIGWSRTPLHTCNLVGHILRKKRWNYWCIQDSQFLFSITIADMDYVSVFFLYYYDIKNNIFQEETLILPLGFGATLGDTPREPCRAEAFGLDVHFTPGKDFTFISVDWRNFKGKALKAKFHVFLNPSQESLNVLVPWNSRKFQYTSKQFALPVEGEVLIDDALVYKFRNENAFASLDFGRGNWPREITWNWLQFATRIGVNRIGVNLGGQWTDGTGISENAILFNDKIFKLKEPIAIEYNPKDFQAAWRAYTTESKNVDLYFTPAYVRKAEQNLFLISSTVHQGLGNYTGIVQVNGDVFYIPGAFGWAEEHKALW